MNDLIYNNEKDAYMHYCYTISFGLRGNYELYSNDATVDKKLVLRSVKTISANRFLRKITRSRFFFHFSINQSTILNFIRS